MPDISRRLASQVVPMPTPKPAIPDIVPVLVQQPGQAGNIPVPDMNAPVAMAARAPVQEGMASQMTIPDIRPGAGMDASTYAQAYAAKQYQPTSNKFGAFLQGMNNAEVGRRMFNDEQNKALADQKRAEAQAQIDAEERDWKRSMEERKFGLDEKRVGLDEKRIGLDASKPLTDFGVLKDAFLRGELTQEEYDIRRKSLLSDPDAATSDIKNYRAAKEEGYGGSFVDWQRDMKKAGATKIDMGGGSDKQIFDAMNESAAAAKSAATGLNALSEAKRAIEGGAITGAFANERLSLQKIGAAIGVADPSVIQNTETFRSAIAPQVAAMMKATVGSTQISNADREFAEKAAGGSIELDEGSILRLMDIMERGSRAVIEGHMSRLDKVYPEDEQGQYRRERALFGVNMPEKPQQPALPEGMTGSKTVNGKTFFTDGKGNWFEE